MIGVIITVISVFFSGLSDKKLKSFGGRVDNNRVDNTVNNKVFAKCRFTGRLKE